METIIKEKIPSLSTLSVLTMTDGKRTTVEKLLNLTDKIIVWSTRCPSCIHHLDDLNKSLSEEAEEEGSMKSHISTICIDNMYKGMEMGERWPNLQQFYMPYSDKEKMKQVLNFHMVPFNFRLDRPQLN